MKPGLHRKLGLSLGLLFFSTTAGATVLVNPPSPLTQHKMGDSSYTITFAGSDTGVPDGGGFYNSSEGYRFLQTTVASPDSNLVWLDLSTNANLTVNSGQRLVATLSISSTPGSEIPLIGASIVSSNTAPAVCGAGGVVSCQGSRTGASNLSAAYNKDSVIRVSFSLSALCSTPGASTSNLCGTSTPNYSDFGGGQATLTQPIVVTFGVVGDSFSTGPVGGQNIDSTTFTLAITNIQPTITVPSSIDKAYFPGDGEIYVNPSEYGISAGAGTAGDGAPVSTITFLANRGAVNSFTSNQVPTNDVVAYVDVAQGTQAIRGFVNSTNGVDNQYSAQVYAQNDVGILSAIGQALPAAVSSQAIKGVLTESKCFIATAAYHDGHAAPVMLLRKFRDRILSRYEWGRKFIETYYRYSPDLAEWAWDKPFVRSFALKLLTPIEAAAWLVLKAVHAEEPVVPADTLPEATPAEVSPQPYLDRVRKQLEAEEPKKDTGTSYTEEIKKKMPPLEGATGSYIDRIKSTLEPVETSEGYSDKERAKLPPVRERESPIRVVKEGRDKMPEPEYPTITQAMGFSVGVNPDLTVVNPGGNIPYSAVYGSKWQPDLQIHYERQLFHSENFGSFGVGMDAGLSVVDGYGKLSFPFAGTDTSQTKFTFLQVPLVPSAYYRFNLLRVLRPYAGAGVGVMLYDEFRRDAVKDNRGFAFVYSIHGGMSLLLDFFDRKTAIDGYATSGIQHTYLFAEYQTMGTLNRSGPLFDRSGIYTGFLFEI